MDSKNKPNKLTLKYGAVSDVGNFRESNQDSGFCGSNLLLVADGMGGHAGGDVASTITVSAFSLLDNLASPRGLLGRKRIDTETAKEYIEQTVADIYKQITTTVDKHPALAGMGTTISLLYRADEVLVSAHLGDSRIYLLRHGELKQITKDHTFVQSLVDSGKITEHDAKVHPQRNVVLRVLGDFDVDLTPDFNYHTIENGDRWFLCSDGICGVLDDDDIKNILNTVIDPTEASQKLVDLSLEAGSTDNCTAVVADVVSSSFIFNRKPIFVGSVKETDDLLNSTTVEMPKIDVTKIHSLSDDSKGGVDISDDFVATDASSQIKGKSSDMPSDDDNVDIKKTVNSENGQSEITDN